MGVPLAGILREPGCHRVATALPRFGLSCVVVEFRLLGPVGVIVDGHPLAIGRQRERALLAVLLLDVGRPIPIHQLIDLLWKDSPPPSARKSLQVHVSRLRALLDRAGGAAVRLAAQAGGYAIHTEPGRVDAHRFTTLVDQARACDDPAERGRTLRAALELWRGPALADLALSERLRHQLCAGLDELRLSATELRIDSDLALGRHHELIPELTELTAAHPTREQLIAAHMLALYRCERQADALALFQRISHHLAEELGVTPGPRMRGLHLAILRDDPELDLERRPAIDATPVTAVRQLPPDIINFSGRERAMTELRELVARAPGQAPTVCVIHGMGGVGKTKLAVHAAHRLVAGGWGQDRQLFVDLHGFSADQTPADPAAVLHEFLQLLGVPSEQIPAGLESRTAVFRDRLSGTRTLLLLDNAAREDQVLPLLPAGSGCVVLVTSRRNLSVEGAVSLPLEVFTEQEALDVLVTIAGAARVDAARAAAHELVRLCGRLPIAVTLAAHRLRTRPAWHIADLLGRLRDHNRLLSELVVGDRAVQNVFALSYQALSPHRQRLLQLLSLHPGEDATAASAAALAGLPTQETEALLEELLDEHVLQQTTADRYRLHDLLRAYTKGQAGDVDRVPPMRRLLIWYLQTATRARAVLDAHLRRVVVDEEIYEPIGDRIDFGSAGEAMAWFLAERGNLVAAVLAAPRLGEHVLTWQLASTLVSFFNRSKHWDDWISTHRVALAAAQHCDDRIGQAHIFNGLGAGYSDVYRFGESIDCHRAAAALFRDTGDSSGQAWNLNNLGVVYDRARRFPEAAECYLRALTLFRQDEDRQGEGLSLNNLGDVHLQLGDAALAGTYLRQALDCQRAAGDAAGQRYTRTTFGDLERGAGDLDQAIGHYQAALSISLKVGDHWQAERLFTRLAEVFTAAGRSDEASQFLDRAQELRTSLGAQRPYDMPGESGDIFDRP